MADLFDSPPQAAPPGGGKSKPNLGPSVHNGTYTIEHPTQGHFTIKVHTVGPRGNLAGKRLVSLLTGPDNTASYTAVAFWNDERGAAQVWKRYSSCGSSRKIDAYRWGEDWNRYEQKLAIWVNLCLRPDTYWAGEGYTMQLSGHCVKCNKKLTDPESIRTGIGPKCGGRS